MTISYSFQHFIAGFVAGINCLLIGHPFDTIKVRQQVTQESALKTLYRTIQYDKIKGLYKGFSLPLLLVAPSTAVFFGVYGTLTEQGGKAPANNPGNKVYYGNETLIFEAGCIAGAAQTIILCPAELIKTMLQVQSRSKKWIDPVKYKTSKGVINTCRRIFSQKGLLGFYRGFLPMAYRDIPTSGLYVLTYETLLNTKFDKWNVNNFWKQTFSGGLAGILSWIIVIPFDVVKTRMQVDQEKIKYKGMIDCFIKSYKKRGWSIFIQGLPVLIIRGFPANAATFASYETTIHYLESK